MKFASKSWPAVLPVFVLCGCLTAPLHADRLHLDSGGFIDSDHWWYDGDWLMYEGDGGTVGIPRAMILRIEQSEGGARANPTPRGPGQSPAAQAPPKPGSSATELQESLRRGFEALQARDFETASSVFWDALQAAPDADAARVGYALAEMALGRDGFALSAVLDGLNRNPENSQLNELLGDLRDREERVEEAVRSWRKAFELAPSDRLREKIFKAERDLQASRDYDFATTSHFNMRFDGDVDLDLAAAMMDYLEQQYYELSRRFAHSPPQPITVLLYPSRQFREVTQAPESVAGLYDGKIRVPLGGLNKLNPEAERVLVHELTHAVVHSKSRGACPRWLHEGLAQLSEEKTLRRAERQKIAELLEGQDPATWESAGFSYPVALALAEYLVDRRGFSGVLQVLDLLGDGREIDAALEHVYNEGYAEICRRWARTFLSEQRR
jgi:tetratricopeptide (TPR) repeat protein